MSEKIVQRSEPGPELNVSLNSHLLALLDPLPPLLPIHLRDQLLLYIAHAEQKMPIETVPTIPYTFLLSISRWSRTTHAAIDASQYTMINLLAGSTTSPNAHFTPLEPREEHKNDRRAIVALINALMSVVGSGVACWWVTDGRGWEIGLRVLFALGAALIVALSEGVLFVIWHAKKERKKMGVTGNMHATHKKDDGKNVDRLEPKELSPSDPSTAALRQRIRPSTSDE